MKGITLPTTISLSALVAVAVAGWQLMPVVDGVLFFEAEAAEVNEIRRRQLYETRRDLARLKAEHETDPEELNKLNAIAEYYDAKLREIDNGENIQ